MLVLCPCVQKNAVFGIPLIAIINTRRHSVVFTLPQLRHISILYDVAECWYCVNVYDVDVL